MSPYTLLSLFLSPWKDEIGAASLRNKVIAGGIEWGPLLYTANLHLCTPLWYVRLKQDRLLPYVPDELSEYLATLYRFNLERNRLFIEELKSLLRRFEEKGIPVILLKGAATFCDDLYADVGARIMNDIDLLVNPDDAETSEEILEESGYEEVVDPEMVFEGLPTDSRHHHLHPRRKPGTHLRVEIHYKVIKGQAGYLFLKGIAWKNIEKVMLDGIKALVLNPTFRVIHNTAHALVPDCEFYRGNVSLRQLAEFSYLARRYGRSISWETWHAAGNKGGLGTEFSTYLVLAQRLFGMGYPRAVPKAGLAGVHAARIIAAGKETAGKVFPERWVARLRSMVVRRLLTVYYYLKLPAWVWRNICYTEGTGNIRLRILYLLKKSASARSRAKI